MKSGLIIKDGSDLLRSSAPRFPAFITAFPQILFLCFVTIAAIFPAPLKASNEPQQTAVPAAGGDTVTAAMPARDWIVSAAANEAKDLRKQGAYLRYRMHIIDAKGDIVRDVIESKDGTVARLILKSGRPLTPEEDSAERDRLNGLITDPAIYAKHEKSDAEEKKVADDLMKLMPDAMIYTYVPGQPQVQNSSSASQIVIDYKPNPKFVAPNIEAEALSGLMGRVWVDAQTRHVVRMEANIFQPVNLGWGMLAHIYPGGKVFLEQSSVGGGRWIYSQFVEQVNVRALMVKTLHVHQDISAAGFQTLPTALSYQDAIRLLLSTPLPGH